MNSVFFADDNILVLNQLRDLVDWEALGYHIVGQATEGASAIEQVRQLKPQLLLTDVEMPQKSGIEVVRELKKELLTLQILMLSNYDDFDYVRQALREGASDYLLKHQLTKELLTQKLYELDELRRKESLSTDSYTYFAAVAKRDYLKCLVSGETMVEPEQHNLMLRQREFSSHCSVMAVMQVLNFIPFTHFGDAGGRDRLIESVINLSENIFSTIRNGLITHVEHGRFVMLFTFDDEISNQKVILKASSYLKLVASNIHKLLNVNAIYQISDIMDSTAQLCRCYQIVSRQLETKPLAVEPATQKEHETHTGVMTLLEEKRLTDALLALNYSQTECVLTELFEQNGMSAIEEDRLTQSLLQVGERFAAAQQLSVDTALLDKIKAGFATTEGGKGFSLVKNYLFLLIEQAIDTSCSDYSPKIREAVQCIRRHYSQNISLPDVAEKIGISPAHLSRQFKKESGSSFVDFLTSYRLEVAKKLICDGMELKEVSAQVGFSGYNYFLRVFKKKTGSTPSKLHPRTKT